MPVGASAVSAVNSYVAGFIENTFGTYPATLDTNATFFEFVSCTFKKEYDIELLGALNNNFDVRGMVKSKKVGGNLTFMADPDSIGFFMSHVFGYQFYGNQSGLLAMYSDALSQFKSLSFNIKKGDFVHTFVGGKVENCVLSYAAGEAMQCSVDLVFKDSTNAGQDLSQYIRYSPLSPVYDVVSNFVSAGMYSYEIPSISFEINFNNNLKLIESAGDSDPSDIIITKKNVSFKTQYRFDTLTTLDAYKDRIVNSYGNPRQIIFSSNDSSKFGNFNFPFHYPTKTPDIEISGSGDILISTEDQAFFSQLNTLPDIPHFYYIRSVSSYK